MYRTIPLVALLATACALPASPPWYAEVFLPDMATATIRYQGDTMHLLGIGGPEGGLHHGVFDEDNRSISWGPPLSLTFEGSPYVVANDDGFIRFAQVDIAPRPGTDELWLYVDGLMGPISGDRVDLTIAYPSDRRSSAGSIAFENEDTLIVSSETSNTPPTVRISLSGTQQTGEPTALMAIFAGDAQNELRQVPGLPTTDVGGGALHFWLDNRYQVIDLPTSRYIGRPAPSDNEDVLQHLSVMTGVADDYILGQGTVTQVCVGTRTSAHTSQVSTKKYMNEGGCFSADAYLSGVSDGDVREDGDQFVVFYGTGLIQVFDRKKPSNFNRDISGSWCNAGGSFTLNEDGTYIAPAGSSDAVLYATLEWSYSKEKLRLDFKDLTGGVGLDDSRHFENWARRTGDTLHMKTTVGEETRQDSAGLTTHGGMYVPCP